jgi:hypothetical protein
MFVSLVFHSATDGETPHHDWNAWIDGTTKITELFEGREGQHIAQDAKHAVRARLAKPAVTPTKTAAARARPNVQIARAPAVSVREARHAGRSHVVSASSASSAIQRPR